MEMERERDRFVTSIVTLLRRHKGKDDDWINSDVNTVEKKNVVQHIFK
jgi:hypothetical protein